MTPAAIVTANLAAILAYLRRVGSHERVAERMAVSPATFYRLLKRGTRALAVELGGGAGA